MPRIYVEGSPSLERAAEVLSRLLGERAWTAFWGECMAEYEGRGASESSWGDVLVIVKTDRSVIVHGPFGFKPMNWQPVGSVVTIDLKGDELVFRALRRSPREILVLRCTEIYMVAGLLEARRPEFYMYMSESEIRDVLASNPEMIEEGLRIVGIERPVDPGFVDMYGYDRDGRLVVFEIKRVKAGEQAARQLLRYVETLRARGLKDVRGVLLAPDFTESAIRLLELSGLEYRRIDLRRLYEAASRRLAARGSRDLLDFMRGQG